MHPSGCETTYKYALKDQNINDPKFGPSGKKGILIGYHMNPGGKWSKDYQVLDIDSIGDNFGSKYVRTRRCGEMRREKGTPKFPCKETPPRTLIPPDPATAPEAIDCFAERQAEPDTIEVPPQKNLPMYTPGSWVDASIFDTTRVPNGYVHEHGRITGVNKKSTRPPYIPPEAWEMFTAKQKKTAKDVYAKAQEEASAAEPEAPPVAVGTGGTTPRQALRQAKAAPDMAPKMPCCVCSGPAWKHREHIADIYGMKGLATVVRPVKPHEVKSSPGAQAAMDKEWASLRELKAWDETNVREWSDVRNEARNNT